MTGIRLGEEELSWFINLKKLIRLSGFMIVNAFVRELLGIIPFIFVGRQNGSKFTAAATLGNMVCNITGYSLAFGMCSALDTLVSQSFGAKKYLLMGLHTQRAIIILTVCTVPTVLIWSQTDYILYHVLQIPKEEADLAGIWARILCVGLWPSLCLEILTKFLQGQGIIWPIILSTSLGVVCSIISNLIFMYKLKLGFIGVAITIPLSQWFSLTVLIIIIYLRKMYINYKKTSNSSYLQLSTSNHDEIELSHSKRSNEVSRKDENVFQDLLKSKGLNKISNNVDMRDNDPENNWPPLGIELFNDWYTFLSLGIPGALSLFIEWGSFELAASIAGRLGSISLATHGIFMTTAAIFYIIPQSVALSTATIIGNLLGASEYENAKLLVYIVFNCSMVYGAIVAIVLLFCIRSLWGKIFSDDYEVQRLVYKTLPVLCVYCFVDATKCILLNVLRSTGRPKITVIGNSISCFAVLLPLGYILAIKYHYGIIGLWLSMSLAWLIATIGYFVIIYRTNWKDSVYISNS